MGISVMREAGCEVSKSIRGGYNVSIRLAPLIFRSVFRRAPGAGRINRGPLDTAGCQEKEDNKGTNQN
jgi:hypothetical protein